MAMHWFTMVWYIPEKIQPTGVSWLPDSSLGQWYIIQDPKLEVPTKKGLCKGNIPRKYGLIWYERSSNLGSWRSPIELMSETGCWFGTWPLWLSMGLGIVNPRHHHFLMGKSTIFYGHIPIANMLLYYQRVSQSNPIKSPFKIYFKSPLTSIKSPLNSMFNRFL